MNRKNQITGMLFALIGGTMWAFSGACGQYLFQKSGATAYWLVDVRLLAAGICLLAYSRIGKRLSIGSIWKNKKDAKDVILFGIFGVLLSQLSFFVAIYYSNAATATILQYIAPALVFILITLKSKKKPRIVEFCAVMLSFFGVILLSTGGDIHSLAISRQALIWGLLSAVGIVVFTLEPKKILEKYSPILINGWGMLIGGIVLSVYQSPFDQNITWNMPSILCLFSVIFFGTIFGFTFYLESIRRIGGGKASIFICIEPVAASFFSVVWLKSTMGAVDYFGMICIVGAILLLQLAKRE